MSQYILNRHEDNGWSVLERDDGESFNIPTQWLPIGTKEGDVLSLALEFTSEGSILNFTINPKAKLERLKKISKVRKKIKRLDKKGDIDL